MGEETDIKKRLKSRRQIKIWFWDGLRQYDGVAMNLTDEYVSGDLRISEEGDATVIPGHALMEGLIKHLSKRTVDMKLTSTAMEIAVKAEIMMINRMQNNPRRAGIVARFVEASESTKRALKQMAQVLPKQP